jgi:hypothetical protein
MRPNPSFVLSLLITGLVLAQEPTPPPIPVPPPPAQSGAVSTPAPPAELPSPRAARAADRAAAERDRQVTRTKRSLLRPQSTDAMLDEAAEVTGLDRETLRPAIEALRGTWWRGTTTAINRDERTGRVSYATTSALSPQDAEKAEAAYQDALRAIPAGKRDAFAGWAGAKRHLNDAGARSEADAAAKESLRSLLETQTELEKSLVLLERQAPAFADERRALLEAQNALSTQQTQLADQMAALAKLRIEGALDKTLIDRYRALATTVDSQKASEAATLLRTIAGTQPGAGGLERQIEDLQAQREAIDSAIERATTALVRERAERLYTEARARDEVARAGSGQPSDPVAVQQPPRAPTPPTTPAPPMTAPAPPSPVDLPVPPRSRNAYPAQGPAADEIRMLREELRKLRDEVEALRKQSDREPK